MNQTRCIIALAILFSSCYNKNKIEPIEISTGIESPNIHQNKLLPNNLVSTNDYIFFADSVLHGYRDVLKFYFKKYIPDSCGHLHLEQKDIIDNFEGLEFIGDINHNKTQDSIFVLGQLGFCKFEGEDDFDGDAYYFTDTTLPRLQTTSGCCHPKNIFYVGDIDEDGIAEIGLFSSSCASHYKSLYVYSLKNGKWKKVGHSVFDLFYMDVNKPYSNWVRKTGRNKFQMLQITDLTRKDKVGKRDWLKFIIE